MIFWTRKQMEEEFARRQNMERVSDEAWQARRMAEEVRDRLKALEARVERLEGLLYKPLNWEELLFPGAVMDCAKEVR